MQLIIVFLMRLNLILTGLILGAIGGFFIGQIGSDVLLRIVEDRTSQLILFCIFGIALIAAAFLVSDRIIKMLTGARNTQIVSWFEETSQHVANALPINPEIREALKVKAQDAFAIYISWRVRATLFGMLIAVVVVIVGSISTHVTLEQNRKLERQNELLDSQNQSVRMQILLSETERLSKNRSKAEEQVTLITREARRLRRLEWQEIQKRDKELNAKPYFPYFEENFWDSTRLVLKLLEPYPVFDSKALIDKEIEFKDLPVSFISRERGTILKSLLDERVNLDHVKELNFDFADMRGYQLINPYLASGIVVHGCDVRQSALSGLSLEKADFANTQLNAVALASHSMFNVSSTTFYASDVSLPFGSRDPRENGRPGLVLLYDTSVQLPFPERLSGQPLSLDNIHVLVESETTEGLNCTEFRFVGSPKGPLIPAISLRGASISTLGVRGVSSKSRMDIIDQLHELSKNQEETIVGIREIAPVISSLLLNAEAGVKDAFAKSLIDANKTILVRLRKIAATSEQLSRLRNVEPASVFNFAMQFE